MKKLIVFVHNALINFYWFIKTIGVSPLEYPPNPTKQRTPEEWQKEWDNLQEESQSFLKEVGNRLPRQWSPGEMAWYESIRRREAIL